LSSSLALVLYNTILVLENLPAEQSSESVQNITDIVHNIQLESNAVASSLRDSYQEVKEGSNQISNTGQTFNAISSSVSSMINNMNHVFNNLTDIATK